MVRWWFAIPLWGRVFMALVAGIVLGLGLQAGLKAWGIHIGVAPDQAQAVAAGWIKTWLGPFGDLFIRLLRMIIVPLIMTTLVAGIVQLGDPKRLGTVGVKTLLLYVVMTLIAVSIGLTFGTVLQPGSGLVLTDVGAGAVAFEPMTISERLLAIVPQRSRNASGGMFG
ncbi:MAG: cation:dicarboxylase symporter family transporter, partial [Asticcacaulis sp.]